MAPPDKPLAWVARRAQLEAGDPTVSLDLLVRALFALGAPRGEIAAAIAGDRCVVAG